MLVRVGFIIKNTGTTRIYLNHSTTDPTTTVFSRWTSSLRKIIKITLVRQLMGVPGLLYKGAIRILSSAAGGTVSITELT
jgi:hypothetical protein